MAAINHPPIGVVCFMALVFPHSFRLFAEVKPLNSDKWCHGDTFAAVSLSDQRKSPAMAGSQFWELHRKLAECYQDGCFNSPRSQPLGVCSQIVPDVWKKTMGLWTMGFRETHQEWRNEHPWLPFTWDLFPSSFSLWAPDHQGLKQEDLLAAKGKRRHSRRHSEDEGWSFGKNHEKPIQDPAGLIIFMEMMMLLAANEAFFRPFPDWKKDQQPQKLRSSGAYSVHWGWEVWGPDPFPTCGLSSKFAGCGVQNQAERNLVAFGAGWIWTMF